MFRSLLLAAPLTLAACLPAHAQAPVQRHKSSAQNPALHALFDDEWERGLRESPENASYNGDPRFNDRWTDLSLDGDRQRARPPIARRSSSCTRSTATRCRLPTSSTTTPSSGSCERSVERQKFREYLQPDQPPGRRRRPPTASPRCCRSPTPKDYQDWLKRLQALPDADRQITALMQEGRGGRQHAAARADAARAGADRRAGGRRPGQERRSTSRSLEVPRRHSAGRARSACRPRPKAHHRERRGPGVPRASAPIFNDEYLPEHARDSIAAVDLPDGKAYYDFLAALLHDHRPHRRPDPRHRPEGSGAHPRRDGEGQGRGRLQGHAGANSSTYLRTDPKFFHKTPEELLERLPGDVQAHRSGAGEGVQDHPAPAVRRAPDPGQHRARHHHRLLPARRRRTARRPATTTSTCTSPRCARPGK